MLDALDRVAKHVTAFIRSPTWVNPSRNMEYHEYTDEEKLQFREGPGVHLQLRKQIEHVMASYFPLFIQGSLGQETALQVVKGLMKQKINNDILAEQLIPKFAVGCRRFTV
jgi:cation diffusion facilitator CzcD-associated flavoprotein CzcO